MTTRYLPYWSNAKVFSEQHAQGLIDQINLPTKQSSFEGEALDTENNNSLVSVEVPVNVWLSQEVCSSIAWMNSVRRTDTSEKPSERHRRFRRLANKCFDIQEILEFKKTDDWYAKNIWDWMPEEAWAPLKRAAVNDSERAVEDAIVAIEKLRVWAEFCCIKADERMQSEDNKGRNRGNRYLHHMVGELVGIWLKLFGNIPTHSKRHPFSKFCFKVFEHSDLLKDIQWKTLAPVIKQHVEPWNRENQKIE